MLNRQQQNPHLQARGQKMFKPKNPHVDACGVKLVGPGGTYTGGGLGRAFGWNPCRRLVLLRR